MATGGKSVGWYVRTAAVNARDLARSLRDDVNSFRFELLGPREFRDVWQAVDSIGGFSRERADTVVLYALAKTAASRGCVVEVGSFLGRSTAVLAQAVRSGGGGKVVAIDPHRGGSGDVGSEDSEAEATTLPLLRHNLRRLGVDDLVTVVCADATAAARDWCHGRVSLLFVDGLHTYEGVLADFAALEPHLADAAVVVFDDYRRDEYPGVVRAVDELERAERLPPPGRTVNRYRVFGVESWRGLAA